MKRIEMSPGRMLVDMMGMGARKLLIQRRFTSNTFSSHTR